MSGDELETKVRDHDEAIRRIEREAERSKADSERANKEMIDGMRSLHKRLSMAQEYQLRDNRLNVEDIKEALKEASNLQASKYAAHETKTKELETRMGELETNATKTELNIAWLDRWVLALSSAFCAYFGWDIYLGGKK